MDKLRDAVAGATERAARSRPVMWLRTTITTAPADTETQRGQGLAEYALILALIAIIAIAALVFLGGEISEILSTIGAAI